MNPPPDRPAKPNDHVPESWQGHSAPGGALWLDPEIVHLVAHLPAFQRALCRHEKNQWQEDEPGEDQLLDPGFHGKTLNRSAGEPRGLNSGETLQDCGETVEIGGEPQDLR